MKIRKSIVITLFSLIILFMASVVSNAATGSMHLGIKMLRSSGYGYKALEKNIWKITEYDSSETVWNYDNTIYCLKGGPGFGSTEFGNGVPKVREYTRYFDMKKPQEIPSPYVNALPDVDSNTYKALLWVLENSYVPAKANASEEEKAQAKEYRDLLLKSAGLEGSVLTDDDIDAVQQLAVWYFTNDDSYHTESFEFWVNSIAGEDKAYNPLSDDILENGWDRAEESQLLFEYFINTAKEKAASYEIVSDEDAGAPVKIDDTDLNIEESNNRYIIGPYKITQLRDINYTLNLQVTDKDGAPLSPQFLNSDKEPITVNDYKELLNKEFYISLPNTTNIENITLKIDGTYYYTKITYWSVEGAAASEQPVVLIGRLKRTYEASISVGKDLPEEKFDLALRKFIVSINGEAPTTSREPVISREELNKLNNGTTTTANKVHPKDALVVATGDKVVYKIRIYNEGNVDGYATEVTDYLPEGLRFISDSQINIDNGWTNPTGDGKTIVSTKLANEIIKAFDGENLSYKDLEVECEVIAEAGDSTQSLKNIAEITKHKDVHGNEDVVDRDSTPDNVDKDHYGNTSQEDDDDFEHLVIPGEKLNFDLALRKFIVSINGEAPTTSREPVISQEELDKLAGKEVTTADKVHPKNPLTVKTGDRVVYTIRVYNEGDIDGYAKEITDYLPSGLRFIPDSQINIENGWSNPSGDGRTIVSTKLADQIIAAFNGTTLSYRDLQVECEVVAKVGDDNDSLKNIAEITKHSDSKGDESVVDRDSTPDNVDKEHYGNTSQEDDDDFEQLVILEQYFDLSLRKFITAVNDKELVDEEGNYLREPIVDTTPLIDGSSTTAIYNHPKYPVGVSVGDEVVYTIRVYNEGQLDGYVHEITDYLPPQLEFIVDDELNAMYGWTVSEDGRVVKTDITSPFTVNSASRDEIYADRNNSRALEAIETNTLLKAFDGSDTLDYIDVKIKCRVKDDIDLFEKITNIAEITDFTDADNERVEDRDSQEENVVLPSDETLPNYKDEEINRGDEYIPGQQDDDDFEKLVLQKFDLALRKFITGVNDTEITNRVPIFTVDENGNYVYEHTKDPVEVENNDIVIYTLRIFNEGNQAGYAEEVKDDIPEGLEFLPDHELNQEYRWKMYREDGTETTNVDEATTIKTDYLSKEQESEDRENLIDAFNPETMTMPDYKDVKVAFRVTEPNTSDRIIINTAEISEDSDENGNPVDDIDSTPDNDEDGEDDIDIEKIKVKYFDLSLKKWVEKAIVTYQGKQTVIMSGHTGDEDPEPPLKVEVRGSRLENTTIKFGFKIKVTNEGEIPGYATEISDYIPEGLEFIPEDNPQWTQEEDGKVVTDQLKDTLLQPGESATVDILLTWINSRDNLGLMTNTAEISDDYNESDTPDIDSTPDNKVEGEDDIDDAPVLVSIVTGGGAPLYIGLTLTSLVILSVGIFLIKKFVI